MSKYQGQERQSELNLNWDSFKWRNYDYAIGRWLSSDPLSEKYFSHSTYTYTLNNPINFTDPDGMQVDTDFVLNKNGTVERVDENDGSENNTNDRLYARDENGELHEGSFIKYDKESPETQTPISELYKNGDFLISEINNSEKIAETFVFLVENTDNNSKFWLLDKSTSNEVKVSLFKLNTNTVLSFDRGFGYKSKEQILGANYWDIYDADTKKQIDLENYPSTFYSPIKGHYSLTPNIKIRHYKTFNNPDIVFQKTLNMDKTQAISIINKMIKNL